MAELTTPIVFVVDDDVHLRREFDLSFIWDHCAPFARKGGSDGTDCNTAPHRRFLESDGGSQPENGSIPNRRARIVRIGCIAARMNDILEEWLHCQPLRNLRLVCDFNHSLVIRNGLRHTAERNVRFR